MGTVDRNINHLGPVLGPPYPFLLAVCMGQVEGYSCEYKFGHNREVVAAYETVWEGGDDIAYLSAAEKVVVSSTTATDTGAGTGARTIQLYGLDDDYSAVNETITLNGTTDVTSTNSYLRVHRMIVRSAGSQEQNEEAISAVAIDSSSLQGVIAAGDNQTMQCAYTVPKDCACTILGMDMSVANNDDMTLRIEARPEGEVFQVKAQFDVNETLHRINFLTDFVFDEKTDIRVRAIRNSGSGLKEVSAGLNLLLVPKTHKVT